MATWAQFLPRFLLDVPRCSSILAEDTARDACMEFFRLSRAHRIDHPPISSAAGQAPYAWAPGGDLKVVRAEEVWYDKVKLSPIMPADLSAIYTYWPDEEGTPLYYLQESEETLILVPKPTEALTDAILSKVSVRPSLTSTGIDDTLFDKYVEQIVYGIKARLFAMREEYWHDITLAMHFKQRFESAIASIAVAADMGRTRSAHRTRVVHGIE
jgi:hypothetical protein